VDDCLILTQTWQIYAKKCLLSQTAEINSMLARNENNSNIGYDCVPFGQRKRLFSGGFAFRAQQTLAESLQDDQGPNGL